MLPYNGLSNRNVPIQSSSLLKAKRQGEKKKKPGKSVNPTAMAQFQLSHCTPSDVDALTEVYIRAFQGSRMYQLLFPAQTCTTDSVRAWVRARFTKGLTQGHAEVKLFKVTEAATGRLAALCNWGYPFSLTDEEKAARDAEKAREEKRWDEAERATGKSMRFPEGANNEACKEFYGALEAMREKYIRWDQDYSKRPLLVSFVLFSCLFFIECSLLGTDPDFQRRGLGSMLLGQVIALADLDGRRIYLEATAAGHPLYEKLSWRDVDLITVDLRKWGVDGTECNWVMMREPQAKV